MDGSEIYYDIDKDKIYKNKLVGSEFFYDSEYEIAEDKVNVINLVNYKEYEYKNELGYTLPYPRTIYKDKIYFMEYNRLVIYDLKNQTISYIDYNIDKDVYNIFVNDKSEIENALKKCEEAKFLINNDYKNDNDLEI
mgnify:CR=1 FL=1